MPAFNFNFGAAGRFAQVFNRDGWANNDRLKDKKEEDKKALLSQMLQMPDDSGGHMIDQSLFSNPGTAIEASFQTGAMLVNEYRSMTQDPDVDIAVDDVINAMVTTDEDVSPVNVKMRQKPDGSDAVSKSTLKKIATEFDYLLHLMDFRQTGYEKVRQWYTDGRQYFQIIVNNEKPGEGIQMLIQLDPRALKKVQHIERKVDNKERREVITNEAEYFLYNPSWAIDATYGGSLTTPSPISNGLRVTAIKEVLRIDTKMIAFCHSGLLSPDGGLIFSHLEKARKPLNNLKMMRDAMVIYRMTRAPERRVHYVDVGSLPPKASREMVAEYARNARTQFYYDSVTGKVSGATTQESVIQDMFMARREGQRGSEITTLQAGQNLGQIEDILYFQKVMFRALNVPVGRLETDGASALFGGNGGEITRDEWKFNKFIQRLRRRYAMIFSQLLKTQLVLKGICTEEEYEKDIGPYISFEFAGDSYVEDQKEASQMRDRMEAAASAAGLNTLVSRSFIQEKILKLTDDERAKEDTLIKKDMSEFGAAMGIEPGGDPFGGSGDDGGDAPPPKKDKPAPKPESSEE
ncbi:gp20 portal vertex protein of head [Delftia phage PhiW-14]|uniref:Portal protein n=1 Tax=Delftia phage PhiW-14 TaxID=665032 RepID=C9DG14_BPW14|nr:gp20 portal vertex protein of head [Delftia phage PhiW-14]ACV50065.1 gp20 portal vertex protein of head [Delftia phage PhiW-14]